MASQNLNLGTSANSNDGDTLRGAFIKLKQMFAEIYGQTYSEQGDLSGTDFKINESKLQLTASGTASDDGKVLTYDHATGGFSWEDAFTGTIGDITGIVAGDGLTGSSLSSDEATLDVGAGTGITVTANAVSLATSVQDEISANTSKTGITATQISEIAANTLKDTDQTVTLTEGANVTITGTYPDFTIASDDVVGAVDSVNGDTGVVVLDTDDVAEGSSNLYDKTVTLTEGANVTITGTYPDFTIASDDVVGAVTSVNGAAGVVVLDTDDVAENTNLYYTEARVAANSAVALNTAKTGITTAQADDITANNLKVSNATHTGDVTGDVELTIEDNVVNAAKLDVSNNGAAGQLLQYNADGTMTWVTGVTGDITAVTAGDGLTGGGTGGDVTLNVVGGDGITASADEISLSTTVAGDGLTFTTGVLSVDTIQTGDVADDAITSPKLAEFDDSFTAGTSGDIIVSNGTDFIHTTMSGDATIVAGGAITIADDAIDTDKILDDAVTTDKLADSINTDIATGVAKVSFPGFGTSGTTALVGNTPLLQLGNSNTTALAGDTRVITSGEISEIAANTLKVSNVTTDLGITGTTGARDITSSDGTDATIPVASTSESGLMSKAIFDEHELNNAKAAGTVTDLGKTVSGTGFTITSSDGADVDLSLADTNNWGLMSDEMFDAQVLNTAKLTNADHTGEVTGSGQLTITDGAVVADRLATDAVTTDKILNDAVTHDKLSTRFTHQTAISTLTGTVNYNCSEASSFKLSGDITGAYTINLTNYKKGQVITIYPLKGDFGVYLTAGTGTGVFYKLAEVDYDGTVDNMIQIECVDDQAANPVFFYSVATFASGATI